VKPAAPRDEGRTKANAIGFSKRDFLFNPNRTQDDRQLTFMVCSVLLGAGLMALLGKWA